MRKMLRVTQKELAERLSTHQSMIARWEKAQIFPREDTVQRIAEALGISLDELLNVRIAEPKHHQGLNNGGAELQSLWQEIETLDDQDRAVLKSVLEAMLLRHRMKDAMSVTTGNWRNHKAS